jgi:hypothetical protein
MHYQIRSRLMIDPVATSISQDDFVRGKAARVRLIAGFDVEQIFDLLIRNYLSVESACIAHAIRQMALRPTSYDDFFDELIPINLAVVNYLSTARMFRDQVPKHAAMCTPTITADNVREHIEAAKRAEFEVRFIEALRDHVQHSGMAVHKTAPGDRSDFDENRRLEYRVCIYTQRQYLEEDNRFPDAVRRECADEVDLLRSLRRHMQAMSRVLWGVRREIEVELAGQRSVIETLRQRHRPSDPEADFPDALEAVEFDADDGVVDVVPLLLKWDDIRLNLQRRNQGLAIAADNFPSGRVDT